MRLYLSYLYHGLKLTQKFYKALFGVMLAFWGLTVLLVFDDSIGRGTIEDSLAILGMICGGIAGSNGLHSSNIESGWNCYSSTLPVTARQKAGSALMVKLIYMLLSLIILVSVSLAVTYINEQWYFVWDYRASQKLLHNEFDFFVLPIVIMLVGSIVVMICIFLFGAVNELHLVMFLAAILGVMLCALWGGLFGVDDWDFLYVALLAFFISAAIVMLWDDVYVLIVSMTSEGRNLYFARILTVITCIGIIFFVAVICKLSDILFPGCIDDFFELSYIIVFFIGLLVISCYLYFRASLRLFENRKA